VRSVLLVRIDVSAWSGVRLDELLEGGNRNEVWSGWSPCGRVAIRRSRRAPESLAWELSLLSDLATAGFLVPAPLLTDEGSAAADGVLVQPWIDGREPDSIEDWTLVASELRRLHGEFVGYRQRPGCRSVTELDRTACSVDADLSLLPEEVVDGDPGRSNVRITSDGRVGLLDWDESRVDVVDLDLANLGMQVLDDDNHDRAMAAADAWEAANAWIAEPGYARERLEALRARRSPRRSPGARTGFNS
jgi:Ser/Thr protein kinase RdoA (MazF antagonist)